MGVKLTRLEVNNFKSIKYMDIALENLNILIGPNDAGKSNFLEIFRLLSDFFNNGKLAINKRGGFADLVNFFDINNKIKIALEGKIEPDYSFEYSIEFATTRIEPHIKDEFFCLINKNGERKIILHYDYFGKKYLINENTNEAISIKLDEKSQTKNSILVDFSRPSTNPKAWIVINYLKRLGYYSFRPIILQDPVLIEEELRLKDDGFNLPTVLQNFYNQFPDEFRELTDILHKLYPQYSSIEPKLHEPSKISFYLKDNNGNRFPMWLLSDGLIKTLCILYLVFSPEPHSITLFEEPEAYIHPHLLYDIYDLLLSLSFKSQIFIATHSTSFLNYTKINDLIYIYKKDGTTKAKRLKSSDIKKELQMQFKPGELYFSDYLIPEELEKD